MTNSKSKPTERKATDGPLYHAYAVSDAKAEGSGTAWPSVERDRSFVATKTLSAYADEARQAGQIVA